MKTSALKKKIETSTMSRRGFLRWSALVGTAAASTKGLAGGFRGRAYRKRQYPPDRLMHPLKRVGKRGEGKFERISWDEALDRIASEFERVKRIHGNAAFYVPYG